MKKSIACWAATPLILQHLQHDNNCDSLWSVQQVDQRRQHFAAEAAVQVVL